MLITLCYDYDILNFVLFLRPHRPVPNPECGSSGVWGECKGQGESSGQRSRCVQRIERLASRGRENGRGGGANGYGPDSEGRGGVYCVYLHRVKDNNDVVCGGEFHLRDPVLTERQSRHTLIFNSQSCHHWNLDVLP